jgi:hypothetical protein
VVLLSPAGAKLLGFLTASGKTPSSLRSTGRIRASAPCVFHESHTYFLIDEPANHRNLTGVSPELIFE